MKQEIQQFFEQYEQAITHPATPAIGNFYAPTFLFGGVQGVQSITREDFLKVIPHMKAYFASLGLSDAQLADVQETPLDPRYLLAKVQWKMTVRGPSGDTPIHPTATYLLLRAPGDTLSIVFQIDHQDLKTVVQDLQH